MGLQELRADERRRREVLRELRDRALAEAPSFPDRARTFIFDRFAHEPVAASIAGVHEHDHRLGGFTAESFAARDAFADAACTAFEAVDENGLSREERTDRALILAELRGERALRPFARWRRQPTLYSDAITRGAYWAFLRDHVPLVDRVAALAERLSEAPAAIDAAMANLDPALVPPEWVDLALRTVPAGAALLRDGLTDMLPSGTPLSRAVLRSFLPAADAAAAALDRYAAWLATDLGPKARGSFAIGREAVDAWLKEKELLDHDAASLAAWGEELYRETEAALGEAAKALGDGDWRDAVMRIRQDHPSEEGLVEAYRAEMERSRVATRESGLATVPYGEDLMVEPMPAFQRPTYPYAAYVGAAPFETRRLGRFWVTLPETDDDERTRRERLEGHPRAGIPVIACHEGYPGHHLQLVTAADNFSVTRKALRSNVFVEGWGLYVEELMTDLGYLSAPETRLLRLKDLLWRAARVIVDVGLSTGEMTFADAVAFMVERPKLEPPNALAEVRRYTTAPLQPSSYALGRAAILGLRDKARAAGWGMRYFHDRLLAAGSLPPRLMEVELGL